MAGSSSCLRILDFILDLFADESVINVARLKINNNNLERRNETYGVRVAKLREVFTRIGELPRRHEKSQSLYRVALKQIGTPTLIMAEYTAG